MHLGEDKYTEVFINEYFPSSELQFHKDHCSTYKEVILGVSLLSDCNFTFQLNSKESTVVVPARSLYLMTGDSRFKWKHGMHKYAVSDRRISLTFRMVNYKQ
eukprot:TRINITY_DN9216_c0_g1_i2.p1 TRINITY_DN9216_c0_g1~~TRINITY_DN9216_c0_g1_i2.p1  ORF type:complete len:102 (-),score=11.32 TRINITY_DN9216_c0_g1_i2:111-416(-)